MCEGRPVKSQEKMKVLFVSSGNGNEGISPLIKNQGESLINSGVLLDYFAINGKGLKSYLKGILRLRRYLLNNVYNILHAHYGLSAIVALIARRNEKLVVSFMGDDILGSRNIDGKIARFSKLISLININLAKHFYTAVVVKSEEMHKRIGKKTKSCIIPNGVDLSVFKPGDKISARNVVGWDQSLKHVIFISDPDRLEKNYALAGVSIEKLNDPLVDFHVVKEIPNNQLQYYYNAADCLVLSSLHEGSPNVIKEAMACNCPIVCTSVGDVAWVLGNTEGCFQSDFDPVDFTGKIRLALRYAEDKGRTNGRERIIKLGLDSESVAKRIVEIYHQILRNEN